MALIDNVISPFYRPGLDRPLVEPQTAPSEEQKQSNKRSGQHPSQTVCVNPGMFVRMLKKVGNKHVQRPILGEVVGYAQESASDGKRHRFALGVGNGAVGNVHGSLTTAKDEYSFFSEDGWILVLRGVDDLALELCGDVGFLIIR